MFNWAMYGTSILPLICLSYPRQWHTVLAYTLIPKGESLVGWRIRSLTLGRYRSFHHSPERVEGRWRNAWLGGEKKLTLTPRMGAMGIHLSWGRDPIFLEELTLSPGTHLLCIESCLMNK